MFSWRYGGAPRSPTGSGLVAAPEVSADLDSRPTSEAQCANHMNSALMARNQRQHREEEQFVIAESTLLGMGGKLSGARCIPKRPLSADGGECAVAGIRQSLHQAKSARLTGAASVISLVDGGRLTSSDPSTPSTGDSAHVRHRCGHGGSDVTGVWVSPRRPVLGQALVDHQAPTNAPRAIPELPVACASGVRRRIGRRQKRQPPREGDPTGAGRRVVVAQLADVAYRLKIARRRAWVGCTRSPASSSR